MSIALQRAQVKTILLAVSGMGNVEDRGRFANEPLEAQKWYVRGGRVNGCMIYAKALKPEGFSCAEQVRRTAFVIKWLRSFTDADSSRKTSEEALQTLTGALLAERTLNGTADNCTEPEPTITDEPALYAIGEGKYLCDLLTVSFIAEEYVAVTYS